MFWVREPACHPKHGRVIIRIARAVLSLHAITLETTDARYLI